MSLDAMSFLTNIAEASVAMCVPLQSMSATVQKRGCALHLRDVNRAASARL